MDITFESDELRVVCQSKANSNSRFGPIVAEKVRFALWCLFSAKDLSRIGQESPEFLVMHSGKKKQFSIAIGKYGRLYFRAIMRDTALLTLANRSMVTVIDIVSIDVEGGDDGN